MRKVKDIVCTYIVGSIFVEQYFFIIKRVMIPEKYKDFYYLRDLDLHAERLSDCPHGVASNFCDELLAKGLLFKTRDEAERVRSVMLEAYFKTSKTSSIHS